MIFHAMSSFISFQTITLQLLNYFFLSLQELNVEEIFHMINRKYTQKFISFSTTSLPWLSMYTTINCVQCFHDIYYIHLPLWTFFNNFCLTPLVELCAKNAIHILKWRIPNRNITFHIKALTNLFCIGACLKLSGDFLSSSSIVFLKFLVLYQCVFFPKKDTTSHQLAN